MREQRDSGALFRLVHEAMKRAGIDTDPIFRRLGVDEDYLQRENLRTPHAAQVLFWRVVEDVTGDPDIGLHLGWHVPTYKGQVLEYLFLSSPTFGEGLKRAISYQRLLTDAADLDLYEGEDECYVVLNAAAEEVRQIGHFSECFVQGVLAFFNSVTDNRFEPTAVHFEHQRQHGQDRVERILGCPVSFGQPDTRLYFRADVLDDPSPHHEPGLLAVHERFASEQVAELEKQDIVGEVERLVAEQLDSGEVTLDSVAMRLDMKPRTLRTRLTEANTSFNQVVSQFRYRLACRLLAATDESIDEIVYLTGFSEPSTFYRAFKRWSGMTPIEYRRQSAAEDEAMDSAPA